MSGWQNIAKSLFNLNNRRIFASVEKPQMEATTRVIRQYIEQVMDKRAQLGRGNDCVKVTPNKASSTIKPNLECFKKMDGYSDTFEF